jgi:hemerythrin-like domain-containing protein
MQELSSLIREHRVIAGLTQALAVYAERIRCEAYVERDDLALFARVFQEFADGIHHEKEENILLPALTRAGAHWDTGVLPEVRREHRQERYLIEVLGQVSLRSAAWTNEDRRRVAATALELAEFQHRHLQKENEGLFPEVPRLLDVDGRRRLEADLQRFDAAPRHQAQLAELLALAAELVGRYVPGHAAES